MKRLAISILTMLLTAGALYAEDPPATAAGKALTSWLEVLTDGDEAKRRAHHAAAFAPAFTDQIDENTYVQICAQLAQLIGPAEIGSFRAEGEYGLSAWAATAAGTMEILIGLESAEPHRIESLLVRPGTPPADDASTPDFPEDGTLEQMLAHAREVGGFPAIAATHTIGGKLQTVAAIGVRRADGDESVTTDDAFHVGSVTKSMTATMLARLIEKGKIDWDTTIGEVLADVEMKESYRKVTLRQLMQHRGGVIPATGFGPVEMRRWTELPGNEREQRAAFVAHALQQEPVAEPGTQTVYSNGGYAVAAHMAERRTDSTWSTLMREELFEPLGLKSAGFGWPEKVSGHTGQPGNWSVVGQEEYDFGEFIDPAGDVHMRVADLAAYANAHLSGLSGEDGLLKAKSFSLLHTPPDGGDYACGWVIAQLGDEAVHWHNGSAGTFYALVSIFPETDEVIAFLFSAEPGAEAMAQRIGKALHGRTLASATEAN